MALQLILVYLYLRRGFPGLNAALKRIFVKITTSDELNKFYESDVQWFAYFRFVY